MVMSLADDGASASVRWDGTELFRYVYGPEGAQRDSPRPYFHPVRTLAGDVVTVFQPEDHTWHKGIAWSLPNVGPENFWGGVTYRRPEGYIQLDNDGSMRHDGFDLAQASGAAARLDERLTWVTEAGKDMFTERRRLAVAVVPDASAWTCAFETTMRNVSGDLVRIGSPTTEGRVNAGYGGLFWRGPASFTGGRVLAADGTVGDAAAGDEIMGWRGPWLAFSGRHEPGGQWSTLVFRDDLANAGSPCQWFVRTTPFACICPAPFFSAERAVPAGAELRLRYDFAVAGKALDVAACAQLAALMTAPIQEEELF
jgi:hypothetical protein